MKKHTELTFTETKRGSATPGKTYVMSVGDFVNMVWEKDCDGDLSISTPIGEPDEDGEYSEFHEGFWDLPIEEQFARAIRDEEDRYAISICYQTA